MMFHLKSDLNLLFESWDISSTKVLVGSCIAVLFASILYEGLKIFRARLMDKRKIMAKQIEQEASTVQISGPRRDCWINMCNIHHLSQTVLHVVQVVLGYLLMLVVMTFQVYLGIAVVIGVGLGYFFFSGLLSGTVPSPNPTPENPITILNLTNFKDLDEKQHQPEKQRFTDFAIENKGFNTQDNDASK